MKRHAISLEHHVAKMKCMPIRFFRPRQIALLALMLFMLTASISASAQDTVYVRQNLRILTSDDMHGRGYSFRGDSIAAQFLQGEIRRLGLKPFGGDFMQRYTFSIHSMEGPLSLRVGKRKLKPFDEFRVPSWCNSTWGKYKVITIPAETFIDADKFKSFIKKNNSLLENVFVYIDATRFNPPDEESNRHFVDMIQSLQRRNPFNSKGIVVGVKQLSTCSFSHADYKHDYAYFEVLASCLPDKFKDLECTVFSQFHTAYPTQNVCGYIEGEVDTMIVYTAHYDHLGTMGDSIVFYGAHDNASGVATLLDLARISVAVKPHYTTVFYFFSGEEAGLRGSRYASEHPLFDFSKVRLLINIDMFCGGNEGIMVFNANDDKTRHYVDRLEKINSVLEIAPEIRRRENRPNSDHYFFSSKMPAVFVLSMGQPFGGYHDPKDQCDACGLKNYSNFITLISVLAEP